LTALGSISTPADASAETPEPIRHSYKRADSDHHSLIWPRTTSRLKRVAAVGTMIRGTAMQSLCVFVVFLVLLLLGASGGCLTSLLLVHDEPRVTLLTVPFEAGKVRVLELVVGLEDLVSVLVLRNAFHSRNGLPSS